MKKKFIKLNDSFSHLSLGNVVNIIKEESINKTSAIRSEVFASIFDIDYINESTCNNYLTGTRSIGEDYKEIYIKLNNKYKKDKNIFNKIFNNILTIIYGSIINKNRNDINEDKHFINITNKLINIAKNDSDVDISFINNINKLISDNNYYDAFVNMLLFSVLEKKQPKYEEDNIKYVIEEILSTTNISVKELYDFLLLELNEGVNFSHKINYLSQSSNAFALFHIGLSYYRGEINNEVNYIKAYEYFKKASVYNHPSSFWFIANMIYENKINKSTKEMIDCLNKGISLSSSASINTLGLCYYYGKGVKKDIDKAISLFKSNNNYAYSYNNLGKYYEDKDINKSIEYYKKSADLKESYACNKIGLYYINNNDYDKAYYYFNEGIKTTDNATYKWNYYNLVKYFYLNGNAYTNTSKDINKSIKYLNLSNNLLESLILLFDIYFDIYQNNKTTDNKNNLYNIIKLIETHKDYNNDIKLLIENKIKNIYENINTELIN